MWNRTAYAAMQIAERAQAELSRHIAVCNEIARQAIEDRTTIKNNVAQVQRDLTSNNINQQAQVAALRGYFLRTLLVIGGSALMVTLGAVGYLASYLLEHIDRLAK